jgi:hypothetical protein
MSRDSTEDYVDDSFADGALHSSGPSRPADPEEGRRLVRAFLRIASQTRREGVITMVEDLTRGDESEQLADLQRTLGAKPQQFRLQFFGVAGARSPTILTESEIWAAEASDVVREAASIAWPARAIGLRVLDQEGREVFERLKADH